MIVSVWGVLLTDRGVIVWDKRGDAQSANAADILAAEGAVDTGMYVIEWRPSGSPTVSFTDPCPALVGSASMSEEDFNALTLQPVDGLVTAS